MLRLVQFKRGHDLRFPDVWRNTQPFQLGKTVFETWDDTARQFFVDGFFERGNVLKDSVLNYLERNRVI